MRIKKKINIGYLIQFQLIRINIYLILKTEITKYLIIIWLIALKVKDKIEHSKKIKRVLMLKNQFI